MAYILFHIKTNMFLKHPNTWTPNLRKATKFQTEEKVNNYMTKNFPFVFKNIPVEDIEILNTDNITEDFESQHNTSTPPSLQLTEETAAEELANLKQFVDTMLTASALFIALPKFYGGVVRDLDMETVDILHKIEFTNENVVNGFRRYKQLQDVRQRRRKAKDALEISSLLLSSGLLASLKTLKTEMEKMEDYFQKRSYNPRVLPELFEEVEEAEEQEDESA